MFRFSWWFLQIKKELSSAFLQWHSNLMAILTQSVIHISLNAFSFFIWRTFLNCVASDSCIHPLCRGYPTLTSRHCRMGNRINLLRISQLREVSSVRARQRCNLPRKWRDLLRFKLNLMVSLLHSLKWTTTYRRYNSRFALDSQLSKPMLFIELFLTCDISFRLFK